MSHNYQELASAIGSKVAELRREIPETMKGFGQMSRAAHNDGALSNKNKELIALAIGIASRCQGCLAFHAKALVELGCSRGEFLEMLQVAVYMGGGPSLMTAAEALMAYESFGGQRAVQPEREAAVL
ncbi:alkylhydroperoxidase like protein, AhpD family [Pseudogulbenkiania sp. NH8B]|uniref:Alkylhydroperoxidase like protein, AhpD family n=1 Tax=Pseudogulbenkiania ferrooxidans 2002 TaxID=279714 RepID=B9Z6E6_9NEIS|nr:MULTISPECIES: carboxymuconolactone decarboxylase family protein [Pseudogulbenkiania]EEG07521.1 alkylhydroperoxidase like protein, AhpD family [Pseudogulbenkiania ferrooxidans 2002]BAK78140.1 alkylhydroperoxidase like protein, AhpD family [Pseudogulbenkiania sp. NH8B]